MLEKVRRQFSMETKKNGAGKKKLYTILTVLFSIGFLVCAFLVVRDEIVEKRANDQFEQLADAVMQTEVSSEIETETEANTSLSELGIEVPKLSLDWDALEKENEDIYSWIYVPGTNVNYPVLQHETENNYYLDRNLDHSKGLPGCIYTQKLNAMDYTDGITVLYGHNMKNGTMFKSLHNYSDRAYFSENRYIYVYTPEKVLAYEVYAACEYSDMHILYQYNYLTEQGTAEFLMNLAGMRGMSNQISGDVEISEDAKAIVLSTCIANKPNNRWIVVGVLVGEEAVN